MNTDVPEGPMLQSKKFVAYLVAEGSWKAIATLVLISYWGSLTLWQFCTLLTIFLIAGFVEAGYILGQASLDKYVRIAKIAAEAGKNMTVGGMSVSSHSADPKPKAKSGKDPASQG